MPLPGFFRSLRFRLLFASLLIQLVFISLIIGNSLRLVDAHLHQHVDEHIQSAKANLIRQLDDQLAKAAASSH